MNQSGFSSKDIKCIVLMHWTLSAFKVIFVVHT
uniref:Uncharacterized protein n=1 Tax=Rhizophora mucronata TaxID=61149 RepID=A0A2P2PU51_RHIMU